MSHRMTLLYIVTFAFVGTLALILFNLDDTDSNVAPAIPKQSSLGNELPASVDVEIPEFTWNPQSDPMSGPDAAIQASVQYEARSLASAERQRAKIAAFRREWDLVGLTITYQDAPVLDEDGNQKMSTDENGVVTPETEYRKVPEAWFVGKKGPYTVGDKLGDSGFVIAAIRVSKDGSGLTIKGVTGSELDIPLAPPTDEPEPKDPSND